MLGFGDHFFNGCLRSLASSNLPAGHLEAASNILAVELTARSLLNEQVHLSRLLVRDVNWFTRMRRERLSQFWSELKMRGVHA